MKKSDEDGQKKSTSFALSPWILERISKSIREKKYTGQSDIASVAFTEHFLLEDIRERDEKLIKIYNILLENEDGRKLLRELTVEREKKIEALNKAGTALVELGEFDEAKKYFDEAQRLEARGEVAEKSIDMAKKLEKHEDEDEEDLSKFNPGRFLVD